MARGNTVKVSDEEIESLKTARDRIFGTDSVPLGQVIDVVCGTEDKPTGVEKCVGESIVTDTVIGEHNCNHDGRVRGAYPENLDPEDFVGMVRRLTGRNIQYLQVVGNMDGHAVYRMINEGDTHNLHSMPWDKFIDETVRVNPDAPGTPDDDPARTVVRTNFDTMRQRRNEEIETGCTCLSDEACDNCGGKNKYDKVLVVGDSSTSVDDFDACVDGIRFLSRSDHPDSLRGFSADLVILTTEPSDECLTVIDPMDAEILRLY